MNNQFNELKMRLESNFIFLDKADKCLETYIDHTSNVNEAFFICFKGFINSARNYLLSVFEDISTTTNNITLFTKSNANRSLIRNCMEATLLLHIFSSHPEYSDKYLETYTSDKKRIDNLFLQIDDNEKYMKRFSWLPRIKGKRVNNLNDLLNFIEFSDEDEKTFYQILIRNFDTFIHPSFNFSESIVTKNIADKTLIYSLFAKEGLIQQCNETFLHDFLEYFKEKISQEEKLELENSLNNLSNSKELELFYLKLNKSYPKEVHSIPFVLALIPNYILPFKNISYKKRNISYLLQDLCTHYDDLLKSYFAKNISLFYTQARHVTESLSLLHTLIIEDEKRNFIFSLHQKIKGYDAKKSAFTFLKNYDENIDVTFEDDYDKLVESVQQYYKDEFDKDIDRSKVVRLNGWALFLKNRNNETVPNAPVLVEHCIHDQLGGQEEITKFILGVFEESNAFLHITPYAILNPPEERMKKTILILNNILLNIVFEILRIFDLKNIMSDQIINQVNESFFKAILNLNNYINNSY